MDSDEPAPSLPEGESWPKISIVTPSYNQGQYIEETIRSVLLQNYPNLEYIIIDGGSTDNSVEIIKKYEPWISYWVSEPDQGQSHPINKGFEKATGEIFAYLNSDDLYVPGCLQCVARDFSQDIEPSWHAHPVQDFSASGLATFYYAPVLSNNLIPIKQDDQALRMIIGDRSVDWNLLFSWVLGKVQLHQPGVFWPAKFHKEVGGFDLRYHYGFDRKFFMELIARKYPLKVSHGGALAYFRLHDNSKTISSGKETMKNRFFLEAQSISKDFEPRLKRKERLVVQSARAEIIISDAWTSYRQGQLSSKSFLKRLILLSKELPGGLFSRFYWGSLRKMLVQSLTRHTVR